MYCYAIHSSKNKRLEETAAASSKIKHKNAISLWFRSLLLTFRPIFFLSIFVLLFIFAHYYADTHRAFRLLCFSFFISFTLCSFLVKLLNLDTNFLLLSFNSLLVWVLFLDHIVSRFSTSYWYFKYVFQRAQHT